MATEPLDTSSPEPSDWLLPTEALTAFQAIEAEEEAAVPEAPPETFFGFRLGSLGFLVAAGTYCEVLESLPVHPLPNTQPWFSGLVNLRGNLVPVLDLHRLLGEEIGDPGKRRLFAIDKGDKTVALWIEGLPEVHSALPRPLRQPPPLPAALRAYVQDAYAHRGHVWLSLRLGELFEALGRRIALESLP